MSAAEILAEFRFAALNFNPKTKVKIRFPSFIALIAAACLTANARDATKNKEAARELPGWGAASDPDGDCKFFVAEDSLLISVPGSERPHDLAADANATNAPRVLQAVRGDFTIQVRVDGRFGPGDESTLPGRVGYNGAGVVAMLDEENVVTLARAVLQRPEEEPVPYANFEIRIAGKLQRIGLTGDHPIPKDGPVYLRIERRGSQICGAVSADGVSWDVLTPKEIPAEWPKELKTGVVAISTSKDEFNPRFAKLQVLNGVASRDADDLYTGEDPGTAKPNLLSNPSFEDGQNGWKFSSWVRRGTIAVDADEKRDGKNSIRIENPAGDDSFLKQTVAVKVKTRYRLTGYIKTKDVVVKGTGATLSLEGGFEHTRSIVGTANWKKVSFEFDTGALDTVKVGPRLGHHGSMAMGVAWFDELSLVEVGPSPTR